MDQSLTKKERQALLALRNFLVHRGRLPSVRELQQCMGYGSPRSAAYILQRLEAKGIVARRGRGELRLLDDLRDTDRHAQTVPVPLVGAAPCGMPLLAEENREAMVPVSTRLLKPGQIYFLLRAIGDSMTEAGIADGSLVLVQQAAEAQNGDIVVALIDGEATIKEFRRSAHAVTLLPQTQNPEHTPIILTTDFQVMGKVVAAIPV